MKKYILYITFVTGMFYAGSSQAQLMTYCILHSVGTHCPAVVPPDVIPSIITDQQVSSNNVQGNLSAPYDMQAMQSGYNTSTPTVPGTTTVDGAVYSGSPKEMAARRKAYAGTAGVKGVTSHVSSLYPNPVLASTRIVLNTLTTSPVSVDVLDANGLIVRTYDYAAGIYNLDVDMARLPQGIYSVRVYGKDIPMENLKVVKQ